MDLVERLIASSCSETCLMGKAAKEITRLRRIEEAAWKVVNEPQWSGHEFMEQMHILDIVLGEE